MYKVVSVLDVAVGVGSFEGMPVRLGNRKTLGSIGTVERIFRRDDETLYQFLFSQIHPDHRPQISEYIMDCLADFPQMFKRLFEDFKVKSGLVPWINAQMDKLLIQAFTTPGSFQSHPWLFRSLESAQWDLPTFKERFLESLPVDYVSEGNKILTILSEEPSGSSLVESLSVAVTLYNRQTSVNDNIFLKGFEAMLEDPACSTLSTLHRNLAAEVNIFFVMHDVEKGLVLDSRIDFFSEVNDYLMLISDQQGNWFKVAAFIKDRSFNNSFDQEFMRLVKNYFDYFSSRAPESKTAHFKNILSFKDVFEAAPQSELLPLLQLIHHNCFYSQLAFIPQKVVSPDDLLRYTEAICTNDTIDAQTQAVLIKMLEHPRLLYPASE